MCIKWMKILCKTKEILDLNVLRKFRLRNMFLQQNLDNKRLIFLSCFSSHVHAFILESSKENDIFSNLKKLLRKTLEISLT